MSTETQFEHYEYASADSTSADDSVEPLVDHIDGDEPRALTNDAQDSGALFSVPPPTQNEISVTS